MEWAGKKKKVLFTIQLEWAVEKKTSLCRIFGPVEMCFYLLSLNRRLCKKKSVSHVHHRNLLEMFVYIYPGNKVRGHARWLPTEHCG